MFDHLRQRVSEDKAAFNFNLEMAQPGDAIDSARTPLPESRKKVTQGTLTVTTVEEDAGGASLAMAFEPDVMPRDIVPLADPMLASARTLPKAVGLGRRLTEKAKEQRQASPSASPVLMTATGVTRRYTWSQLLIARL